jgi:hypothetical protein
MQEIPEVDDKTTTKAQIKGLTPGPIASHLTRKNPRRLKNFFMNWKSTSCLMMIIAKEWPSEMKHDKATEK